MLGSSSFFKSSRGLLVALTVVAASTVLVASNSCRAASPAVAAITALPEHYRDIKFYTTSRPDPTDNNAVLADMQLLNRGRRPLDVRLTLASDPGAGFGGAQFAATIAPAGEAHWVFPLRPPAGFRRSVLQGTVAFGGTVDRDLYVAVEGPDPAGFDVKFLDPLKDRANVVATYAPRTLASIQHSMAAAQASRPEPRFTLAAAGKSNYSVIIEPLPAPPPPARNGAALAAWKADAKLQPGQEELVNAVDDLCRCIKLQTGAALPVYAGAYQAAPAIRLHLLAAGDPPVPANDGYRLSTDAAGNLTITAATLEGLANGIYGLLTDHLGCHWFAPRQLGEEIPVPPDHTLRLPALDDAQGSAFSSSTGMSFGNSPHWDRQNRSVIDRGRMNYGHSWDSYINKAQYPYAKFPDMWARDRQGKILNFDEKGAGWSATNFCSTSPLVIDIVAKKVNAEFDADPSRIVVSLDPNDYAPMCLCDRCLALDRRYGQMGQDGKHVADRLLHFSQEIYDRLEPQNKGKYLGILIYGWQLDLPVSAKPHPHHSGTICEFTPLFDFSRPWDDPTSAYARKFMGLIHGWGALLKSMGYYDYYDHYYFFGPFGVVHKLREDLPAARENGVTFLVLEADPHFAMQGLNNYLCARLAWDINADVDVLSEEYFQGYYGPAAAPIRDFFMTSERYFALSRPGRYVAERVGLDGHFWSDLDADLTRAEAAVSGPGTAGVPQRFKDRIKLARDGFEFGRFEFDIDLTRRARAHLPVDRARARALLTDKTKRAWAESLKAKYGQADPYWPPMVSAYAYPDFDQQLKDNDAPIMAPE